MWYNTDDVPEGSWYGSCQDSIIDDTSECPQPEVGQRYRSFADTIEIIAVSPQMMWREKTDRVVRFKVIEVHSPEDSSMDHDDVKILWGDLIDGYTRVTSETKPAVLEHEQIFL